jgi:hypothetical protein
MTSKLQRTTNYSMFDSHHYNRPMHSTKALEASMRAHGFMPSSPIQVVPNGGTKLQVVRGHHRLDVAKRLGIPIYYVVDQTNTDLFSLEGSSKQSWSVTDFVHARAASGDQACRFVRAFAEDHGLSIGVAASMLGGESGGSTNMNKLIRNGTFAVKDSGLDHAQKVVLITDAGHSVGISFVRTSAFVGAVSLAIQIPELDIDLLRRRIVSQGPTMAKRTSRYEYLDELETIYNYKTRQDRLPIRFRAIEEARDRKVAELE